MAFNRRDVALKVTKALPGSATTVYSDAIDLGLRTPASAGVTVADFLADVELLLSAPALATALLPDTQTVTYKIEHDDAVGFGTVATLLPGVIVQTGASSAGAAAATFRFRLPTSVKRYIRVAMTKVGAADASAASATLEVLS